MKRGIITIFSLILLAACGKKEDMVVEKTLRAVKYQKVEVTDSNLIRRFPATIQAETESKLSFRVSGTIEKKHASLGDEVYEGQVLAELDNIDYEVRYHQSIANLEEAKSNLVRTQSDFKRYQKLYFNDNVSKAEYDNSLANFRSAKAQVKAFKKQVEYNELQLSYTKLLAPAAGSIGEELIELNETVSAGNPIYNLSLVGDLEVKFFIPESLISQIERGQKIDIAINDSKDTEIEGVVTNIGSVSTGFGRTFPVEATIDIQSEDIKSGMTAEVGVGFNFSDEEDVIVLPLSTILTDAQGNTFIYTITKVGSEVGTATKTIIATGKTTDKGVEIVEGLEEGDLVVTAGMSKLMEGERVIVPPKGGSD